MTKRAPSKKRELAYIKELLLALRASEVTYFNHEGLEVCFAPKKPKPIEEKLPTKEDRLKQDEDVLFYSTR
jgi:hypothetical protein